MKNFLFNLIKSTAKATQNAGGGASRKLMRHEDARSLAQSDNRYCIGNASDLSPRLVRLDSVSILSRQSDLRTYVGRIAAILVLVLTVGIGKMWGADFTATDIKNGSSSGNITVSTAGLSNDQSKNVCSGTKANSVSANTSAGATYSNKYIEIQASSGYTISTLSLLVRANADASCVGAVVFWNGTASATCNSYNTFTAPANNSADCSGTVSITVPAGTRTVRIYRAPQINSSTKAFTSGDAIGGTATFNIFSISATAAAAAPSGPSTSADTQGAEGEVTFESWTSLSTGTCYWKDGIKCFQYSSGGLSADAPNFTSKVDFGYMSVTAGSSWGSYNMSGLVTYAHFALGVRITTPSVVEVVVDNNQSNDLTLAKLFIKKDDVSYGTGYGSGNYTSGTDIKSRATITRVTDNTGRYKISIPVSASDLATTSPYIIKFYSNDWTNPIGFVFESVTVKPVYTVTYNANGKDGGGAAPTDGSSPYVSGSNVTVLGNTNSMTKTDCVFNGWNTSPDGTGTHYDVGAVISSISENITLYAEWVGYATSWEWWNCGQDHNSTTFTYITSKNYICSFASSASTAVASWDIEGGEYYRGIKIKTKDHSIAFWVQTGKRVSITFGTRPTKPTFTVGGVDKSSEVGASTNEDSITVTYTTTSDTKFYIENETATNTAFTVKSVKIEDAAPSCGETTQAALTLSSNSGAICGTGTATFIVSGGSGTGALSVATSDPSKATASIDGSTVTVTGVAAGSATITVTKACDATYAEKTATYSATVSAIPTANAGAGKVTEPGTGVALAATAAASGCTGAWTIQSGPNTATSQLSSTSSATATFTPTAAGTYTLRWTVTNSTSGCSAYDEMTVSAVVCSISDCGNATITYAINGGSSGSSHSTGGADLISSATASNTTALGASTTVGYTVIEMSDLGKKAAAATSDCYPSKPNMSGKIDVYNGAAYSSSNYLEFAFTVKTGYTFTPCDIEFTVQPVDVATNFRWEVTNGTNVYGYGTATDVPKGSDGGASVLTGLTSTAEMAAGTYYIRLYPYVNAASKTFRISNNVILKGTTASAVAPSSYTLTWDFNGGGCTETAGDDYTAGGDVTSGTTLVYPSNSSMSKPGYKFNGWSSSPSTMPESDLTLTAQWTSFTMPNVSGLGVDDGATLSSIPLSWTIPGICDLSKVMEPFTPNGGDGVGSKDSYTYNYNAGEDYDDVYAVGDAPKWGQYGIGFPLPSPTSGFEWLSYEYKGKRADMSFWLGIYNKDNTGEVYNDHDNNQALDDDENWQESGKLYPDKYYWGNTISGSLTDKSITHIAIYVNSGDNGANNDVPVSVRNIRYHLSGQNDIDHVVLMRKEGSAATGPADASATKLYEGTKSHYTDASDVTGKNYYYTVFAVHASGAVSTGVSTSLTLYTITYNAGAYGTGTVPAGKKTHGFDFTLSSSTFTRDGFTQDGWSTSDGGDKIYELGATYSTDAALTLYPHWVAVSGPVITNGNPANGSIAVTSDGSTPILSAVTGSTVYIEATPNTGYNFTSWDVYKTDESGTKVSLAGSTASTTFEMPSYAVTVNASFAAKTYTVTLNGNGGTGNTGNVTATYASSSFSSSITNPTKTGYIFDGWYSGSGGSGTLIISTAGVLQSSTSYSDGSGNWTNDGNVTLYAKWSRDEKTAGWGAPWGGTAIPNATTSTVNSVTLNACNSAKGTLWSQESYTMGDGDSITINLPTEYYISAVSTAALFDEYGGNTNKLYIQFNSESTYDNSKYDLDAPITLGDDCYDSWETLGSATPVSVSPIPSGAQSAKIYCSGNSASGNYLYRIIVEITAWDCTPQTVTFANGGGTGSVPLARAVCGEFTLPGSGSLAKKGNTFAGWSDGTSTYKEGDTYDVTEDVTFTAQWSPFVVPVVTGLEIDDDYALTWSIPGKLDLSTASLSNSDPDYFIVYQEPAGSKSYNSSTEELTVTYTVNAEHQPGVAIPFTLANLESITYDYKGLRVFPAVVKSDGSTLYWDYDNIPTSDSWTRVTQTPTTIYPNEGIQNPLPAAKAITFSANPLENKTNESFYIRNVFYHCTGMIDVDHVVLMRKEGSAATDTTAGGTAVRLYSGKMSHYADETVVKGKTYYYTVFSVHADGSLSAGTTQSATVPKDVLDITYAAGTASSVTHNSATLPFTMSATTGVASVTLKVYNTSDVLVKTVANVTAATSGSGNVTGLDPNTTYYFTVTPIGDATHNDGSESTKSSTFTTEKITPTKYNVTAETIGSCNEASVTIILEDSEDGVTYELYKDGSATGTTITGTGDALNWSGITAAGEYTIWTVEDETYASVQMDNDGYTTVTVVVKDDAELAYDDDEIEKTYGDAAFTNTLTNSHSVSVTYSSSAEGVATVNSSGQVTILHAGSTTITASFAGDATYCAASVSYELTVAKADLSVSPSAGTASSVTHYSATLPFTLGSTSGVASVTLKVYKNSDNSLVNTIEGVTAATSGSGNVTGLDAETTYYYTVTPIGDADHNDGAESSKSATFTTSAATLSALVAGTLYEVPDMIPGGESLTSDDQFFEGLSANTKFELIGSGSSSTTPKVNNKSSNDRTIAGITFDDGSMWFRGNATVSENIPSTFGLSFIVPSAGKLYLYFDDDDTSTNIKLAKSGTSGSKPTVSSGYSVVDVTSGTYYMYGTSTSSPYSFYGLKFVPTYDITLHDNNGGDNNGSADVAVNGTTLLDIDAPTRSGYIVTGYYAESDYTTLVADAEGNLEANVTVSAVDWTDGDGKWIKGSGATLYAKWVVVYTVAFNTNGGSSVDAITQTSEGGSITMPVAPTKDGYTFQGWYIGSTSYAASASYTPTANVTAYASWKAECGVIKWDFTDRSGASMTNGTSYSYTAEDGETEMRYSAGSSDAMIAYDSEKSIDGYLKENGNTGGGTVYDIDGKTNVGKTRLIRLFVEPGSGTLRINCNGAQNGVYKVLDGSASGTTLISSLSANTTSSSITLTTSPLWIETTTKGYINDIRWTPSSTVCYYVTYNGNGADGGYVNDPEAHSPGDNVTTLANSFTRTGCTFTGWNTAADGSGTAYVAGGTISSISSNVTLYAQWKITVSENKNLSEYTSDALSTTDVVVTNGATLTVTEDTEVRNITVETGSTLNVNTTNGDGTGSGVMLTVHSLSLKGGWNSSYTTYDMPRIYIDPLSTLTKSVSTVNFDISVDHYNYYPFAVPFRVKVSDINYADPTLAYYAQYGATGQYVIKEYDGERRAEKGPDHENNWKVVPQKDPETNADIYLEPGRGYIMTAVSLPAYGGGIIRIPLSFTNAWTALGEQGTVSAVTKNIVPVTAYTGKATEGDKFANKGWNLLGVPFMSCYTTSDDMGTSVVMQGKFNFETGEWDGEDKVRYVNVPVHDFSEYIQVDMEDEKTPTVLRPGWCFFVQIGTTGNLTFLTADQAASSSLPIYAPKREKANMPTVKTGIILSDGEKSDQTTFLVSDRYSAMDYEINADLEKLFGNGYTLAIYSLSGETRLAYNALSNADAANIIPIGYRAPAEGEYTFSINPSYAENGAFESVNLIDYETGIVTDLLVSSYTFDTERTQNDERFALNVVKAPQTATDITVTGDGLQVTGPQKVIINDKLYIIVDGRMYDAKGAMVK